MMMPRVFSSDYTFLSCGSVFTDGLASAAADLGVPYDHCGWDDPGFCDRLSAFNPDLILVVHGRKYSARFPSWTVCGVPRACWLLDDPYEVDDSTFYSSRFDRVFVNDRATLHRHNNASYLPVCFDPHVHKPGTLPRIRKVGFIGGCNGTRERYLSALAHAGVLDYVVGGDWTDPAVQSVCLSRLIQPAATAALYGVTQIVLNVFRETHHYNREGIAATALNPRVYEALACGALVVSEWRAELDTLVPELPTFRTEAECVEIVTDLLTDPERAEAIRVQCASRLAGHTYADRLRTVLARTLGVAVAA